MQNTVLVIGGAGYIGSHTCKLLKERGYLPVACDNLVYGHQYAVKWGPFCEVDILDKEALQNVFRKYAPLAVIHFAAFAYVGESVVDPGKYYTNNVSGTINVLEAMRAGGCSKIIFSSTCATFGVPESIPISESAPQRPINPYGRSKLMIEQILQDYDQAYDINYVSLRYFNAAGADHDLEIGEDHFPETHLIPLVLETARGSRGPLEIFGSDYNTSDGTAIRDYVHVTDLADAHLRALEELLMNGKSECFNLGSGIGVSVQEIVATAKRVCNVEIPVVFASRRIGDPPILVADATKAREILGWSPKCSDIETIIRTAWQWQTTRQQ